MVKKMSKTKKELEAEVISLTSLMRQYAEQNLNLRIKVNEYEALVCHYEVTIALLIARLKEQREALSSPANTVNQPVAGNFENKKGE